MSPLTPSAQGWVQTGWGERELALLGRAATVSSKCSWFQRCTFPSQQVTPATDLPDQALVPGLHRVLSPMGDADNSPIALSHRSSIAFTVTSTENGPGSKLFPKLNDKAIKIFSRGW